MIQTESQMLIGNENKLNEFELVVVYIYIYIYIYIHKVVLHV